MKEPITFVGFFLGTLSGILATIVVEVLLRLYDSGIIANKISRLIITNLAFRRIKRIPYLSSGNEDSPPNLIIAEWLSSSYNLFSNDKDTVQKGLESLEQLADVLEEELKTISLSIVKVAFKQNKFEIAENKFLQVMGRMGI